MRNWCCLATAILAASVVGAAGCGGITCDFEDDGTYYCTGGYGYDWARCDAIGEHCAQCVPPKLRGGNGILGNSLAIAPLCQVGTGLDVKMGVCSAQGECTECASVTTMDACTALVSKQDGSYGQGCSWNNESKECRLVADVPGGCPLRDSGGVTLCSTWKPDTSANYTGGDCVAIPCADIHNRPICENSACTWSEIDAKCSGCECTCNGCMLDGSCWPASNVGEDMCTSLKGDFCSCQKRAPTPADRSLGCTSIFTPRATRVPSTVGAATAAYSAQKLCESTDGCKWKNDVVSPGGLIGDWALMGRCGECFAHSDCASGSCRLPVRNTGLDNSNAYHICNPTCDAKSHCNDHGAASFDAAKSMCTCKCDEGWVGNQCDVYDCRSTKPGEPCAVCKNAKPPPSYARPWSPQNRCLAADGSMYNCRLEGDAATCGFPSQTACDVFLPCGSHGTAAGDTSVLCYCECDDGWFGPRCGQSAPQDVFVNPSAALSIPIYSNIANRYLRIQTCEDPSFSCTGAAPAGAPNAYRHSEEWLPPRQKATLHVNPNTTVIVFLDMYCLQLDYELWRPKGGWKNLGDVKIPDICAQSQSLDLGCGSLETVGHDPFAVGACPLEIVIPPHLDDVSSCVKFPTRLCHGAPHHSDISPCAVTDSSGNARRTTCSAEQCCGQKDPSDDFAREALVSMF